MVVSNNPYELSPTFSLGQRHRLDVGTLQVLMLGAGTLDKLDLLLAGTLRGAIEFHPALRNWTSEHLEMGVPGESVRVGVDGEPITLEAPLRFSVERGALRALLPEELPEDRGASPPVARLHTA